MDDCDVDCSGLSRERRMNPFSRRMPRNVLLPLFLPPCSGREARDVCDDCQYDALLWNVALKAATVERQQKREAVITFIVEEVEQDGGWSRL